MRAHMSYIPSMGESNPGYDGNERKKASEGDGEGEGSKKRIRGTPTKCDTGSIRPKNCRRFKRYAPAQFLLTSFGINTILLVSVFECRWVFLPRLWPRDRLFDELLWCQKEAVHYSYATSTNEVKIETNPNISKIIIIISNDSINSRNTINNNDNNPPSPFPREERPQR